MSDKHIKAAFLTLIAVGMLGCSQVAEPTSPRVQSVIASVDDECYQAIIHPDSIGAIVSGPNAYCPWSSPVRVYRKWRSRHGECYDPSIDTSVGYVYACKR